MAAISGTCKEFGLGTLTYRSDTIKLLKKLQGKNRFNFSVDELQRSSTKNANIFLLSFPDQNDPKRATVLNIDTDFVKLFNACFGPKIFLSFRKRVSVWSRFLLQFAIIGRASDVTGNYCPLIENCTFPTHELNLLPDGMPRWIEICLLDWKSRPTWHKTAQPRYKIRIYANHIDLRFCPLHWLFVHWELEDLKSGPLVIHRLEDQYRTDLKNLFTACGFDYSSHSVRRSAAQWARRCGADLVNIRNVGRWVSFRSLLFYIAEAEKQARTAMRNNNNIDPVIYYWIFDTDTMIDTMDRGSV